MRFLIVGAVLGLALAWPAARSDDSASKEHIWEGTLGIRPGVDLRLIVRMTDQGAGELAAVMDSPDEGLKGLKLTSVTVDKSRLSFELKVSGARYDGKLNAAGTQASGQWNQQGANLPLTFIKKDKPTPEPKLVGKEQLWQGKLPIGNGIHYRFLLRLATTETGEMLGKLDSLDEGFKGLKLSAITLDKRGSPSNSRCRQRNMRESSIKREPSRSERGPSAV